MRRILFLTLTAFSKTGGIEKFNRSFSKALNDFSAAGKASITTSSVYDDKPDEKYVSQHNFRSYKGRRWWFILNELWKSRGYDEIIAGHINMALLVVWVKRIFPSKKIVLIVHGIEVMEPVNGYKKKALDKCDEIWTVSEFTRQNVIRLQQQPAEKTKIFYNTIDPFFHLPQHFTKPAYLKERYTITPAEKVLLTVTRLNHTENYKGYDKVIAALPIIKKTYPSIRYIIAGAGDEKEINKIKSLLEQYQLQENVLLTGYVPDEELTDHFLLSDVFVMPSSKEGFGIVFIEALTCGAAVIGGNKDGTVDALVNGQLGTLVNPDSIEEIASAVVAALKKQESDSSIKQHQIVQQEVMGHFGFEKFKKRLADYLAINN